MAEPSVEEATALVEELYEARDKRFAPATELKERRDRALAAIDSLRDAPPAEFASLRGRALNVLDQYDEGAEEHLSAAVKLDPSSITAWNSLGACLWKKGDLQGAENCFESALELRPNAPSLCQLSILLRNKKGPQQQRAESIARGVECAKEAVSLDLRDGGSWYVLGNAYTTSYFEASRDQKDLQRALSAYTRADACGEGANNPDLHFNRGNVLHFLQEYGQAIESYQQAAALDPSLPAADTADTARRQAQTLSSAVSKRASIKKKRITALVSGLAAAYGAGQRTYGADALREGDNAGCYVPLALLMTVCRPGQTPACFACVDSAGTCVILSIYNFDADALRSAASKHQQVVVVAPRVKHVQPGFAPPFRSMQIARPDQLLVEGEPLTQGFVHASVRAQTHDA